METTVWIVTFDPEFISSSGFSSLVLFSPVGSGTLFFCDLNGFKSTIETKQRLEGFQCALHFLLKKCSSNVKKLTGYSLKEVYSGWIFVLGLLTRLQWHWNPRLLSVIDWIISSWHWNDLECLMILPVFLCLAPLCQKKSQFLNAIKLAHLTEDLPLKRLWLL